MHKQMEMQTIHCSRAPSADPAAAHKLINNLFPALQMC